MSFVLYESSPSAISSTKLKIANEIIEVIEKTLKRRSIKVYNVTASIEHDESGKHDINLKIEATDGIKFSANIPIESPIKIIR